MKQIASMKGLLTFLILLVLIFALLLHCHAATSIHYSTSSFNRSNFPDDFVFGAASSAYQFEGAAFEDGRGPSIWDTYTHEHPERISDHSNGDVAVDFYHRYKDDIHSLKELGMDAFRFSISWSRILPGGKISKGVNHEGVRFYNNLINELIAHGLKPFVTLFHWDSPQALDDEYGGWLSPNIVDDYRDYVDFCFKEFGDRVKHWITLNEPGSFTSGGYAAGIYAPGRCSNYTGRCSRGDSATEPYIVAHHLLLAHAAAVEVYKNKYQASQQGKIGVTLSSHWFVPKLKTAAGLKSPSIALDFMLGWFLHPITYGNYPASMRSLVGDRLPKFSSVQSKMLKGSLDFLGLNYYTANYASPTLSVNKVNLSQITDSHTDLTTEKDGVPIGQPTALRWLFIYPKGIRELVLYVKDKYKDPDIYITENGMADLNNSTLSPQEATRDELRIKYHKAHLWNLCKAIKDGAKLKGYFAWSFLDDFEWETGFSYRFGLIYIDYKDGLKRYPKVSAFWFKKFLNGSAK